MLDWLLGRPTNDEAEVAIESPGQPSTELIHMVASIARIKDSMVPEKAALLDCYGLYVQTHQDSRGLQAHYEVRDSLAAQLEFTGNPAFLEAPYTATKQARLKVTKYNPGEWEQSVTHLYIKARRVLQAANAVWQATEATDGVGFEIAKAAFESALEDSEPYDVCPIGVSPEGMAESSEHRPGWSGSAGETGCSPEEWRDTVVMVLKSMGDLASSEPSADAAFSLMVTVAQGMKTRLASRKPEAAALQRVHFELLAYLEKAVKAGQANIRLSEVGVFARRSGREKQQIDKYRRANQEQYRAQAELEFVSERFALVLEQLAENDKKLFKNLLERLSLPDVTAARR